MTAKQYCAFLEKHGLSMIEAAPIFCVSGRQSQRFAYGEAEVPDYVVKLVRVIEKYNVDLKDLG